MALNSLNTLLLAVPARSRRDAAHRGAEVLGGSLSSEGRRAMQRRFRPAKPAPRMSCSRTPVETARARVRAAGLRGDALAAEHDARAYVAAVHRGMLRDVARRVLAGWLRVRTVLSGRRAPPAKPADRGTSLASRPQG
jgi:hypothetical protein